MEKKFILILLVLFIMNCSCLYISFCKKNKENMANTDDSVLETAIKKVVNNVYQADIDAIRNLASISKKLQSGGKDGLLTIPGNVKIEGTLDVNKNINAKKDIECINTIHGKTLYAKKNNSIIGHIDGKNYLRGINRVEGKVETTIECTNTIYGKTLQARKNNSIIGHSNGENYLKGNVNMNSNLVVNNDLTVNGKTLNKYVRYIQIGNKYALQNKIAKGEWAIVQFDVFDQNGRNISLRKSVRKLKGTRYNSSIKPANIVNGLGRQTNNWYQGWLSNTTSKYDEQLLEIDLEGNYQISHIRVWNRWDNSTAENMNGTHVELFDSKKKSIYVEYSGRFLNPWLGLIWDINLNKSF